MGIKKFPSRRKKNNALLQCFIKNEKKMDYEVTF